MNAAVDPQKYPLSLQLTRRVVTYLVAFRLFISLGLAFMYLAGAMTHGQIYLNTAFATTALVSYIVLAMMLAVESRRSATNYYYLANISILTDVLFLSLLLHLFGGLDSGLGVVLVFIAAMSAIVLPLRHALFFAALTTLALLTETVLGGIARIGEVDNLVRAGLFGFMTFVMVLMAHGAALWIRDYRLIAERQQRTLTSLEQINELIIRRMRGGVLAVDKQGAIRMMNESAWFLLGSPPAQVKNLVEVSPELDISLGRWAQNPTDENRPVTLLASQAQIMPRFVALPGEHEIRTLIFLEDNDVVAQRAIELSANSLAKLSGSIAHEIRNPLAAVSHAAQLLAESEEISDPDRRLIDIIYNQSRRMNGIVENILQLSRREKSRPEIFDLTEWMHQVLEEFRSTHGAADVQIDMEVESGEVLVVFDQGQLHQAVWKLMENAMEHAGRDGQAPWIKLKMARQPHAGYCVITIEDNGPGILPDRIGRIFEPFFTTRKQGSGLGLYIARQLCEANQGELTVDSNPDFGTRFHIRLTIASGEAGGDPESAA